MNNEPDANAVLALADIIREVNGNNRLGAAALAEAILSHPDMTKIFLRQSKPHGYAYRYHSPCGGIYTAFDGGKRFNRLPYQIIPYWLGVPEAPGRNASTKLARLAGNEVQP